MLFMMSLDDIQIMTLIIMFLLIRNVVVVGLYV